jgi:hypothetical protein
LQLLQQWNHVDVNVWIFHRLFSKNQQGKHKKEFFGC